MSHEKHQPLSLLIVSRHPAQTHVDLYRRLALKSGLAVQVLYADDTTQGFFDREFGRDVGWDIDLTSGYTHKFLKSGGAKIFRIGGVKDARLALPTLAQLRETWRWLRINRPNVVLLPGHGDLWYLFVWVACGILKISYIVRGEGVIESPDGSWRRRVSQRLARAQVRRSAVFCYIGIVNFYFGLSNGAKHLVFSPYCIDTSRFAAACLNHEELSESRTARGLDPARPVVVFSGKLRAWKRPDDIIRAVSKMSTPVQALILGDGPMREELEQLASDLGVTAHFVGFVNQSEMPGWYALGDVFVLPSGPGGDTWGLAVNEALALGLTPVVSDAVPSWPDLAWGEGGVYPVGDTSRLAACIAEALEIRGNPRHHLALRALQTKYSIEEAARGIEEAVHRATGSVCRM